MYIHPDDKFKFGVRFWIAIPFEYRKDNEDQTRDESETDNDWYMPDVDQQIFLPNDDVQHYESKLSALSGRYMFSDCFLGTFFQQVVINEKSVPQTHRDYVNIWVCHKQIYILYFNIFIFVNLQIVENLFSLKKSSIY